MRNRALLIMSVMLVSSLIVGCADRAETVRDDMREESQALEEESAQTTADDEEEESQNESTSRFDEAERRNIFDAIVAAQDRAGIEAEESFPIYSGPNPSAENVQANFELANKLSAKYAAGVRAEYGISEDEELAIGNEGTTKGWLTP